MKKWYVGNHGKHEFEDLSENQRKFVSNVLRKNPDNFRIAKKDSLIVEFAELNCDAGGIGFTPIFRSDYPSYNLD